MLGFLLAGISAFWLGVLTSISPCPLTTNIAAISYLGQGMDRPFRTFLAGLAYTLGRMLAYVTVAGIVTFGLLAMPVVSGFLQKYMPQAIGPLLTVVGMVLVGLWEFNWSVGVSAEGVQPLAKRGGIWGAGLLGGLFALSFCPVSAALFFGSLIPLSVENRSPLLLPSLYGLGTGLPVVLFAILIALGGRLVGRAFQKLRTVEWWARRLTGWILIGIGVFCLLHYNFATI